MTFYDEMAELAEEMLEEFGADGILTRTGPEGQEWNPVTEQLEPVAGAPLSIPVRATVGPIQMKDDLGRAVTVSVATMREKPLQGDTFEWGELTYIIGNVTALPLQGKIVAYIAEVQ